MKPRSFMLIAGEPSGDMLAAELVQALRQEFETAPPIYTPDYQPLHTSLEPRFFGAGGPRMAAAGVDLAFDLTAHSIIGLSGVVPHYLKLRGLFERLYQLALEREPDAIICVDYGGFNRRFAHAIKQYVRSHRGWFQSWDPKITQYVSPQVWASREGRARQMARDYDLLLAIFPFEKEWYAKRVPRFAVEFVGHPLLDRYGASNARSIASQSLDRGPSSTLHPPSSPALVLLPGSRAAALKRHLPVILGAVVQMKSELPGLRTELVLPSEALIQQARGFAPPADVDLQCGGLAEALMRADLAIASSGTVTMECAYFGVPTVAMYKGSWADYLIARQIVKVQHLAMPNLLAKEEIFPEFIQAAATPENVARAALELLRDAKRRATIKAKLSEIVAGLGGPGASRRAARAILGLLRHEPAPTSRRALAGR